MSDTWLILFGPGGVGKGTIAAALANHRADLVLSRSWTSRPHRTGETDQSYEFVTAVQFEEALRSNKFIEWTTYLGHYYGTPTPTQGRSYIFDIERERVRALTNHNPSATVAVLVLPPSLDELRHRLTQRGDEPEAIARRIERASEEITLGLGLADSVLTNRTVEQAVVTINHLLVRHRNLKDGSAMRPSERLALLRQGYPFRSLRYV